MVVRLLLLAIVGLVPLWSFAEPAEEAASTPEPEELRAAVAQREAAVAAEEQAAAKSTADLREWYLGSLATFRKDAITQGNLDHVLAVDAELARVDRDLTAEERAALYYALRELRYLYDRARRERAEARQSARGAAERKFAAQLESAERSLARQANAVGAQYAHELRDKWLAPIPASAVPLYRSLGVGDAGSAPWYVSYSEARLAATAKARQQFIDAAKSSPFFRSLVALGYCPPGWCRLPSGICIWAPASAPHPTFAAQLATAPKPAPSPVSAPPVSHAVVATVQHRPSAPASVSSGGKGNTASAPARPAGKAPSIARPSGPAGGGAISLAK